MAETNTPQDTPIEVSSDQALQEAQIASDRTGEQLFDKNVQNASQRLVEGLDGAKLARKTALKIATTTAIAAAFIPASGEWVANSVDQYVQDLNTQNQQWSDEAEQNQLQQEFENGLHDNKVVIEVDTPAPPVENVQLPETPAYVDEIPTPVTH